MAYKKSFPETLLSAMSTRAMQHGQIDQTMPRLERIVDDEIWRFLKVRRRRERLARYSTLALLRAVLFWKMLIRKVGASTNNK